MYIYQIMSNNFGYIDIILLGMIAGFIILRLRNILGRRTGHESKIYPTFSEKEFSVPKKDTNKSTYNHETLEGHQKKRVFKGCRDCLRNNTYIICFWRHKKTKNSFNYRYG